MSIADVLADPERFHDQTLADPIEGPAYGRGKAKVFRNTNGSVVINSFAHGGIVYRLRHDAAFIEAQISAAGDGAPFVLAGLMPHVGDMDAVTRERLRNLAAKLGKVSRTAVKATIEDNVGKARKDAIEAAKARRATEQAEAAAHDDSDANADAEVGGEAAADAGDEANVEDWEAKLAAGIAELNQIYFVAGLGARFASRAWCRMLHSHRERLVFSRAADIKLLYAHRHYLVGFTDREKEIWKSLGEAWLSDCRRRTYNRIELITDGPCPPDVYNLWRGFGVEPDAGAWGTLKAHLWSVICSGNEEHYRWLVGWLAYCVQNPASRQKSRSCSAASRAPAKAWSGRC